jgi:U3 small nucleolar RNA-associated protein 25
MLFLALSAHVQSYFTLVVAYDSLFNSVSYQNADLNAMCSRWLHNKWGALRVSSVHSGVIASIVTKVRQIFQRIECSALEKEPAERFEFFLRNICCSVLASAQKHTIIFIRSYFDFVRLRNYLKAEKVSIIDANQHPAFARYSKC